MAGFWDGSGISWTICKQSAPGSRQIATPIPHRSIFYRLKALPSKELRERLGVDDIALVLQQNRLRWNGHVLRKDDDHWVKKCMEHEVEGSRPRGRPGKRLYVRTVKHVS